MVWPAWAEPFLTGGRSYAPQGVDARRAVLDRQGFVWVTGEKGTFRFDGVRYLPATRLGLPEGGEAQLAVTSDGAVWAQSNLGLHRLEGGRFEVVDGGVLQQPIAAAGPLLYTSPSAGWLKVWYRTGARWQSATLAQGPVAGVRLHGEQDGVVWYSGAESSITWVRWRGGRFESGTEKLRYPLLPQKEVLPVNDGLLFTAGATKVLRFGRYGPAEMKVLSEQPVGVPIGSRVLNGDSREPRYQVCGVWASPHRPALRLPGVLEVAPDFQSGLWAARGALGLMFVGRQSAVNVISHREFPDRPVRGVARSGKRLYVARVDSSAVLDEDETMALCDQTNSRAALLRAWGLPGEQAPYADVEAAPDGSVWVLARDHGAVHLSAEGKWLATAVDLNGNRGFNFYSSMRELAFSPDGRLWVASKQNLFEVTGQPLGYRHVFPGIRYTGGFVRDRSNRLFAITEGGFSRYEGGNWLENAWPGCMLSPRVRTVAIASESEQWIGYRDKRGFTRATHSPSGGWKCQHFTEAEGFPGDTQFLAFDLQQRLWRGSDQGLFVARSSPRGPGDWTRLGQQLGLPAGEMHQLFHEEPDGAVLVAIGEHLVKIPPRLLDREVNELPRVSYLEESGRLTLDPAAIQARFGDGAQLFLSATAERELAAPAPLEYRWDEAAWTAVTGHQLGLDEAPAGVRRLQFRYAGAPGILTLPFRLDVPWFRSRWFQVPALVALLAGLIATVRPLVRRWRFQASKRRFLAGRPQQAEARDVAEWPPDTLVHDRYRIEGLLARGGFSDVFAATDRDGTRVVVKRLRQGDLPVERLRRRFAQEIASVSMVRHEGILPILDTWIGEDGVPHLVLPRVKGPTLRQRLNAGPMPRDEARALLTQLAGVVAAAHAQSVVHSDLKPENILLLDDGKPVVIDFGTSALHMQAPLSEYSRPAGSVQYMAPEQLLGRYSRATDVYAFALLSVELLTGRRFAELVLPFDEQWEPAARQALVDEMGFRPEAAAVLTEGLRFDPQQRAQDIADWQARLDAQL